MIMFNGFSVFLMGALLLPQTPDEWRMLAGKSDLVIRGEIESKSFVVDKSKIVTKSTTSPDGNIQWSLPNPKDYILGRLIRIRVNEVVKRTGRTATIRFVDLFLPGGNPTHAEPLLIKGREYFFFLSSMRSTTTTYPAAVVQKQQGKATVESQFRPAASYALANGPASAVDLTGKDADFLRLIKSAVAKSPAQQRL
jgi:hypothetical protein